MQILVVGHNFDLAWIWAGHLTRQGHDCTVVSEMSAAFEALRVNEYGVIVLDLEMPNFEAHFVADFATYRDPDIPILAVTASGFFSGSSVFELLPNVRGCLTPTSRLSDMTAMVEHYGNRHLSTRKSA
ncbi:hypothetical protein [Amaricoccus tamworthensis]|uniref:hypothetical protein n=1 Tax=Amaricoccus tamworthensis TaxID=57002 RepID=UPI003C7CC629